MRLLLLLAVLAVVGCGNDDQAFNANALTSADRYMLQDAMDAWNESDPERASFSIDPAGGSVALYADHRPHLAWWKQLPDGASEISILTPAFTYIENSCHFNWWREELGHSLGYDHGEHKWVGGISC